MASWPPDLVDDLKVDLGIAEDDTRDDEILARQLAAAVAFVERVRGTSFNFAGDPLSSLPSPHEDIVLGTVRLAGRWHTRRRSPDGLVDMGGELGSTRVPSVDPDVERLLGIGRYRGPVIA